MTKKAAEKTPEKKEEKEAEFTPENIKDLNTCVTNNIVAAAQDRKAVIEVINFEQEFLVKAHKIQEERNAFKEASKTLKKDNAKLSKKVAKLERENARKVSK